MVIGDIIIFIITPTAPSVFSDLSASDLSAYESSHNEPDSDNFDPDSQVASSSDQSGYESDHNEPDSDNIIFL